MLKHRICLILFALSIAFSNASLAMPHPQVGDFDGDNFSDLSVAFVNRQIGTTAWLI